MKNNLKRLCSLLLVAVLCSGFANASGDEILSEEEKTVIEICRIQGIRSQDFPDDIQNNELTAQSYAISGCGNLYKVWIVSTSRQKEGVEFGWVSYQSSPGMIVGGWDTMDSYLQEQRLRELEMQQGTYIFWSPEEKAHYADELYGDEYVTQSRRIVYPTDVQVSQEEAIQIAFETVQKENMNIDVSELLIACTCWEEDGSLQWFFSFRNHKPPFQDVYGVLIDANIGTILEVFTY